MQSKVAILKEAIEHLLEHINQETIDLDVIQEMHGHMDDMDEHINHFHETIEKGFSRWRRYVIHS